MLIVSGLIYGSQHFKAAKDFVRCVFSKRRNHTRSSVALRWKESITEREETKSYVAPRLLLAPSVHCCLDLVPLSEAVLPDIRSGIFLVYAFFLYYVALYYYV